MLICAANRKPGLLYENGAENSTLIKILAAYIKKIVVLLNGKRNNRNTHEGQILGISAKYQELSLVNDLFS
jgi:ribose transport system ATP-binding protein